MDLEKIDRLLNGNMGLHSLTDKEREIALKILNNLEGTLIIRATSILEFCLKAIQFSKYNN